MIYTLEAVTEMQLNFDFARQIRMWRVVIFCILENDFECNDNMYSLWVLCNGDLHYIIVCTSPRQG